MDRILGRYFVYMNEIVKEYIKDILLKIVRNAENGRNSPLQGRVQQLVIQHQVISPENIHTINILTQKVIFRNIYVYTDTYIHATTNNEKRNHEFERGNIKGIRESLEGEKGREK